MGMELKKEKMAPRGEKVKRYSRTKWAVGGIGLRSLSFEEEDYSVRRNLSTPDGQCKVHS